MLIHLITICIGLIIAFGLQQIVELFQRRRRVRATQAATQVKEDSNQPPGPTP